MSQDPLSRFVQARGALKVSSGKPFNSGEHMWVADEGAALACRRSHFDPGLMAAIPRRDQKERLSYGEIVALSGDFYATPEDLFDEKPGFFSWFYEGNDISDLRKMFEVELDWIRKDGKTATNYPDQNIRMWWNAKGYLELALSNTTHFGWHNMKAYVRHHGEALKMAANAQGREDEMFRQALYTNAFADHFLTDGFAAGHIRVPRGEIKEWANRAGKSEKLAGALSKLLHDQDGHVSTMHGEGEAGRPDADGLAVRNARGDSWFTRCDGQLFLPPQADKSSAVKLPVEAVAASVGELLVAWKNGSFPVDAYAATLLVAIPDPGAETLIEKFPSDMPEQRMRRLLESVKWYESIPWIGPGLNEAEVRTFFRTLPQLMHEFRGRIAEDLEADPELSRRLPVAYIDAYRAIG